MVEQNDGRDGLAFAMGVCAICRSTRSNRLAAAAPASSPAVERQLSVRTASGDDGMALAEGTARAIRLFCCVSDEQRRRKAEQDERSLARRPFVPGLEAADDRLPLTLAVVVLPMADSLPERRALAAVFSAGFCFLKVRSDSLSISPESPDMLPSCFQYSATTCCGGQPGSGGTPGDRGRSLPRLPAFDRTCRPPARHRAEENVPVHRHAVVGQHVEVHVSMNFGRGARARAARRRQRPFCGRRTQSHNPDAPANIPAPTPVPSAQAVVGVQEDQQLAVGCVDAGVARGRETSVRLTESRSRRDSGPPLRRWLPASRRRQR